MAIFGNIYDPTTRELLHAATPGDIFANYFFALVFFLFFLLSLFCNPYVFFHYRREKQNVSAVLFQILTVNDFCTCVVGLPYVLYLLLVQDLENLDYDVHSWQVRIRFS